MRMQSGMKTGLDDPRAVQILTTEHWSLLSARTLGYQEMFGRATLFVAVLSATIVALALLAQATRFGRETLLVGALMLAVALFIGLVTFLRSVAINSEDARWVEGMNLLRHAYLEIVPELEPYFVTGHEPGDDPGALAHGAAQRPRNLASSLTTTSSVVAALDSALAGALASALTALAGLDSSSWRASAQSSRSYQPFCTSGMRLATAKLTHQRRARGVTSRLVDPSRSPARCRVHDSARSARDAPRSARRRRTRRASPRR